MKPLNVIRSVKASHEDRLLGLPGVSAVDIGKKLVKGKATEETAIRVYVEKKRPRKEVPAAEVIPAEIDGVKTDVIERKIVLHNRVALSEIRRMADTTSYNPLVGGISIGPCTAVGGFVYVGTLGCVVKDRGNGEMLMLTNYHVLAEKWAAGEKVCQPSRPDGGSCPANTCGSLVRSVISERVDGAVARIAGRPFQCRIQDIGNVAGKGAAAEKMEVRKRGRTTGLTHGIVDSVDLSVNVPYDDGTHVLKHQIGITADPAHGTVFGQGGDSGSVVVDASRKVIGLYFAGTEDGSFGVANPIQSVLDELNVDLCVPGTRVPKSVIKDQIDHQTPKRLKDLVDSHKLRTKEFIKDRKEFKEWKEFAFEGPDWRDIVTNPPVWDQPIFGGPGPAMGAGVSGGGVEEVSGGDAVSALVRQGLPLACTRFSTLPVGTGPNPRSVGGATYRVFAFGGAPAPNTRIVNWGGRRGLDAGYRTVIRHRSCKRVTLTLMHWAQPARVRAFNAAGALVATRTMSVPQGTDETLTLSHVSGIVQVVIDSPADEVVIRRYCHCAKSLKETAKDKLEKLEKVEKPEKLEKLEKAEKPEIKELKEPKEVKEGKEVKESLPEGGPKLTDGFDPNPNLPQVPTVPGDAYGALAERLARLEAMLATEHFINAELRPDLSQGALREEPDAGGDDASLTEEGEGGPVEDPDEDCGCSGS